MEQTRTRQDGDYQIPASDGELLVDPAPACWRQTLRENRERVREMATQPGPAGLTFGEISTAVRRRALALARHYTRLFGDDRLTAEGREDSPDSPLLATGHQPLFYHPGIWAKNVVLSLAAKELQLEEGITPLLINLVVDSDAAEGLVVAVPEYSPADSGPSWRVVQHPVPVERQLPFESLLPPTAEELTGWVDQITRTLAAVNQPGLVARWQAARTLLTDAARPSEAGERPERWTVAEWTTAVRRRWERGVGENVPRYLDLPISWLARTPEFFWYALDIFARAEIFHSVYNRELAEYRRNRRIRSRANPFPDLLAGDDFWELPFWLLAPAAGAGTGRPRTPLACRRLAGGEMLIYPLTRASGRGGEAEGVRLPAPPGPGATAVREWERWRQEAWEIWQASGWELRPKAVTLTLFVRMTLADLFIHGVGGGRYDRVTEAVALSFYGIPLPAAAVVSFTAHLALPVGMGAAEKLRLLRVKRRELEQNPQRHLDLLTDPQVRERASELARIKDQLIARLATAARQEKKTLAQQLSRVTGSLAELFAPVLAGLDAEIAHLEIRVLEEEVGSFREYPFFLYDPARIYAQIRARWGKLRDKEPE
ncbi:MAG: hypothetical protein IMX00_10425 [Limnochordales bacterium]|nr:hypothetical protein [Limnochordales bacterium]